MCKVETMDRLYSATRGQTSLSYALLNYSADSLCGGIHWCSHTQKPRTKPPSVQTVGTTFAGNNGDKLVRKLNF